MSHAPHAIESGLFSRVFSWLVTHRVREGEIATLSRGDLSMLAKDLGVSRSDLTTVPPAAEDHRDLMRQMIRAHGLDPAVIRERSPALVLDMEATCARCTHAARCHHDLVAGKAAGACAAYCGNAETLDAMIDTKRGD